MQDVVFNGKHWDGNIPERRYAIFTDIIRGEYLTVIASRDIDYAEKWGGFVSWVGGVRKSEKREIKR